jgi:hypothetical protein
MMTSSDLSLFPLLVEVVTEDQGQARVVALGTLGNLSAAWENKVAMATSDLHLLRVLVDIVREDQGDARIQALGTLWNLAVAAENKVVMAASAELGLLPLLVDVVKEDKALARVQALGTLHCLSNAVENQVLMATSTELGLMPVLVQVINEDSGEARVNALGTLWGLTLASGFQFPMATCNELGLLPLLANVAREDKGEARGRAIGIIWELRKVASLEVDAACKDLDLCALALEALADGDFRAKRAGAEALSNAPKSIDLVRRQDLASSVTTLWERILCDETHSESEMIDALFTLWICTQNFGAPCAPSMAQSKVPQYIAKQLSDAGPIVSAWKSDSGGKYPLMLDYAMNLARHGAAVDAMKAVGFVEIASALLVHPDNGCERLKAMYIVAFLTGKDEYSQHKASVAQQHPDIIAQLVLVLENTLNRVVGKDYQPWTFCLRLTINACQVLSISDGNKELLLKTPLLPLLVRALQMFVDGDPPILFCGGGGDDVEAAELAVATITQLSFYYDSDGALQANYLTQNPNLVDLLARFIDHEEPSEGAKDNARLLIKRLSIPAAKPKSIISEKSAGSSTSKHIMLSYCWHATARPDLVKQLYSSLTARGYDVWRDEVSQNLHMSSIQV